MIMIITIIIRELSCVSGFVFLYCNLQKMWGRKAQAPSTQVGQKTKHFVPKCCSLCYSLLLSQGGICLISVDALPFLNEGKMNRAKKQWGKDLQKLMEKEAAKAWDAKASASLTHFQFHCLVDPPSSSSSVLVVEIYTREEFPIFLKDLIAHKQCKGQSTRLEKTRAAIKEKIDQMSKASKCWMSHCKLILAYTKNLHSQTSDGASTKTGYICLKLNEW